MTYKLPIEKSKGLWKKGKKYKTESYGASDKIKVLDEKGNKVKIEYTNFDKEGNPRETGWVSKESLKEVID